MLASCFENSHNFDGDAGDSDNDDDNDDGDDDDGDEAVVVGDSDDCSAPIIIYNLLTKYKLLLYYILFIIFSGIITK